MAYARKSADSDVELRRVEDGSVECVRCTLDSDQFSIFLGRDDVLHHLAQHRDAGHRVPPVVMARFVKREET